MPAKFNITAVLQIKPPTNLSSVVSAINQQLRGANIRINVGSQIAPSTTRQINQINKSVASI